MLKHDGIAYLPAQAAAEALGTTHLKILMLLREEQLQGALIDGSWYVSADSVAGYHHDAAAPRIASCRTTCTSARCGCH